MSTLLRVEIERAEITIWKTDYCLFPCDTNDIRYPPPSLLGLSQTNVLARACVSSGFQETCTYPSCEYLTYIPSMRDMIRRLDSIGPVARTTCRIYLPSLDRSCDLSFSSTSPSVSRHTTRVTNDCAPALCMQGAAPPLPFPYLSLPAALPAACVSIVHPGVVHTGVVHTVGVGICAPLAVADGRQLLMHRDSENRRIWCTRTWMRARKGAHATGRRRTESLPYPTRRRWLPALILH
ncbi:hypothetical protein C8R47DRAFT_1104200 [Mycena vitilis]|nr:hypothetical protein C8R47DRAFT_1104200 [Mycena vitilis]